MIFSIQRLILIGYAALLFLCTHMPLVGISRFHDDGWFSALLSNITTLSHRIRLRSYDKWFHWAAFMILTLLVFWAAASYPRIKKALARNTFCVCGLALIGILLAWGFVDEATQPIFGRVFDWHDYLANVLGIATAACLVAIASHARRLGTSSRAVDLGVDAPVVS